MYTSANPQSVVRRPGGGYRFAASGVFRFVNVPPSKYNLSLQVAGFKTFVQSNLEVGANETRDVGKITLELGNTTDRITVIAEATTVQLASAEKSQLVDSNQLADITLKGRDLSGYMKLVPGVIDRATSRDVTSPNAIGNITINGNVSALNFTVDGITDMDTGSHGTLHHEPHLDAIQEMKVLTSNAELHGSGQPGERGELLRVG